jgi:hypothetical protein
VRAKSAWPSVPALREVLLYENNSIRGCAASVRHCICGLRCLVLTPSQLCRCIATLRRHTFENGNPASAGKARFCAAHPAHKCTIIDTDHSQAGFLLADTRHCYVLCSIMQGKLAHAELLYCRCGDIAAAACCKIQAAENPSC